MTTSDHMPVSFGGDLFVTASANAIELWDQYLPRLLGTFDVDELPKDVTFAYDVQHFVTTNDDGRGDLWDVLVPESACELAKPYVTVAQVREVMGDNYQMRVCGGLSG